METSVFKPPVLVKIQHHKQNLGDVKLSETFFVCCLSRNKQLCWLICNSEKHGLRYNFFSMQSNGNMLNLENVFKNQRLYFEIRKQKVN